MTIKRFSLIIFFIAITLSIGIVSVSTPLHVEAQNGALSQGENGEAEPDIRQSQSSDQDNQVVSGDSSITSGNNLLCQDEANSKGIIDILPNALGSCLLGESPNQLPNIGLNVLTIDVVSIPTSLDITVRDETDGSSDTYTVMDKVVRHYVIPVGHHYSVEVSNFDPEDVIEMLGDCKQVPDPLSCKGVMESQPQLLAIISV